MTACQDRIRVRARTNALVQTAATLLLEAAAAAAFAVPLRTDLGHAPRGRRSDVPKAQGSSLDMCHT